MKIIEFKPQYQEEIINLVLDIQNNEAAINLPISEQPDLSDIQHSYIDNGGGFWIAVEDGKVIGTIGAMRINDTWCALKKFFVHKDYRRKKVGFALYSYFLLFASGRKFTDIILDTPSVTTDSHAFYKRVGFKTVRAEEMDVEYNFPDRDSYLFHKKI